MASDGYQQALPLACCFAFSVLFHADIVVQRSPQKNVVPGSDGQRWDSNFRIVILDIPTLPIVVIVGMRQPVEKVWSQERSGLYPRNLEVTQKGDIR